MFRKLRIRTNCLHGLVVACCAAASLLSASANCPSSDPIGIDWSSFYDGGGPDEGTDVVRRADGKLVSVTASSGSIGSQCYVRQLEQSGTLASWTIIPGYGCYAVEVDAANRSFVVSVSSQDAQLSHVDPAGNLVWTATYGLIDGSDAFYDVVTSNDGGIYVAGHATFGNETRALVARYDLSGNLEWEYVHPTKDSELFRIVLDDQGVPHAAGHDGGYALTVKLTPQGALEWANTETGTFALDAHDLAVDGAGNVVVGIGKGEPLVVKYAPDGTKLWMEMLSTTISDRTAAVEVDAGGFVYAASSADLGAFNGSRVTVTKYDPAGGAPLWSTVIDAPGVDEEAIDIELTGYGLLRVLYNRGTSEDDPLTRPVVQGLCIYTGAQTAELVVGTKQGLATSMLVQGKYPVLTGRVQDTDDDDFSAVWTLANPNQDLWEIDKQWIDGPAFVHPLDPVTRFFKSDTVDWISIPARAGQTYRIGAQILGARLQTLQMQVFGPKGEELLEEALVENASMMDDSDGPSFPISFTAPEAGTYHIAYRSLDGAPTSDSAYQIHIDGDMGPSALASRIFDAEQITEFASLTQLADGSFVVVGETTRPDGTTDAMWARIHPVRGLLWQQSYGGPDTESARDLVQMSDGSLLVGVGAIGEDGDRDVLLVSVDPATGQPFEQRAIGGRFDEQLAALVRARGDGLFVVMSSRSQGGEDADPLVVRLEESLTERWSKIADTDEDEFAQAATRLLDGSLLVLLDSEVDGGATQLFRMADDEEALAIPYGYRPDDGGRLQPFAVHGTRAGGFVAAGTIVTDLEPDPQPWIGKFDAVGLPEWSRMLEGEGAATVLASVEPSDGGALISGEIQHAGTSQAMLIQLNEAGEIDWQRSYQPGETASLTDVILAEDGGFAAIGGSGPFGPSPQPWKISLLPDGTFDEACGIQADLYRVLMKLGLGVIDPPKFEFDAISAAPELVELLETRALALEQAEACELLPPPEVRALRFVSATRLEWNELAEADSYTLLRGDTAELARGGTGECLAAGLLEPRAEDPETPRPGEGWFYLVAGVNELGAGSLGAASDGSLRGFPSSPCDE